MSRSWEDRVDEYVDSPRMRERIKDGSTVFCRIQGNSGIYRTRASVGRKKEEHECTCPAAEEYSLCKHVAALLETYRKKPRTFVDLEKVMKGLGKFEKKELLALVRKMAHDTPGVLSVIGVKGFERVEDFDPEVDGW